MTSPVVLLGAGASVDSGLPTAFGLTERVYDVLESNPRASKEAKLFGFIVAKLILRQARKGLSPFTKIDIESVYDSLKRFLNKDRDIISEFVTNWDSIPEDSPNSLRSKSISDKIVRSFKLQERRSLSGLGIGLSVDRFGIESAIRDITNAISRSADPKIDLGVYIETLARCLTPEKHDHDHMRKFLQHCSEGVECVATLNYDMIIEKNCEDVNLEYDYGLKNWNLRRYVKFSKEKLKILKLHGSLNWFFDGEDEIFIGEDKKYRKRALIFGGQEEKLSADGPFLHLRHDFFSMLRNTNVFAIIGYSFSDKHLNALIRSWVKTRLNSKLIIVNPTDPENMRSIYENSIKLDEKTKQRKSLVEIVHIKMGFSKGVSSLLEEMKTPPSPPKFDLKHFVRVIQ